jgi:uridylate kinase
MAVSAVEREAPDARGRGFRRILLKLSGESLLGSQTYGSDPLRLTEIAGAIAAVVADGVETAIVVGGGNIYRGISGATHGMDRASADYAGMLATVLNAVQIQDACERLGVHTRILSALDIREVAEPYIRRRAIRHLEKGRVVIFAGGTGNPFFTTDTAAALRACEVGAETILMGKNGVDGVLSADPRTSPDAHLLHEITHLEAIERGLKVMDTTALSLCMENEMPIRVFNVNDARNIVRVSRGEALGTLVASGVAVAPRVPRSPKADPGFVVEAAAPTDPRFPNAG